MQPTEMVLTTLIGDHPGIILVKFGQNPMSGFREDVSVKKFMHEARPTTDDNGRWTKAGHNSSP